MAHKRAHLKISGRVQGVFYRATARDVAMNLNLKGWVKNLSDGGVEAVAEGDEENVEKFIEWCNQGPSGSKVQGVDAQIQEPTGEFKRFEVIYW